MYQIIPQVTFAWRVGYGGTITPAQTTYITNGFFSPGHSYRMYKFVQKWFFQVFEIHIEKLPQLSFWIKGLHICPTEVEIPLSWVYLFFDNFLRSCRY